MECEENVNHCLGCGDDQNCCHRMGLKISKQEFEGLFKEFSRKLRVLEYKGFLIVSTRDNTPCPHWTPTGCTIYEKRPIDCRIFPYNLHKLFEARKKIIAVVYGETHCPIKEEISLPIEEAKVLISKLARQVYDSNKPVEFQFVFGKNPPDTFGVLNPLVSRFSRWLREYKG